MPEHYKERIKSMRPQFEAMALETYGITINQGKFGIDSRAALIGAKYAEANDMGVAYHDAVFKAYWQEARDIGDHTVLLDIARQIGLDTAGFEAALVDTNYEMLVDEDIEIAQQINVSGVPALLFNRKYMIPGAQPYDELARIIDYIRHRDGEGT